MIKQKIQSYALYLLNKRMMTESEISEKLLKKFSENKKEIGEVMGLLKKEKLIDDEKFVLFYLEYETNNNFRGKFWYWQKLYKKGINKDLFELIWSKINPNELEMAKKLIDNNSFRFNGIEDLEKKKSKMFNYLKGRWFNLSIIFDVIKLKIS